MTEFAMKLMGEVRVEGTSFKKPRSTQAVALFTSLNCQTQQHAIIQGKEANKLFDWSTITPPSHPTAANQHLACTSNALQDQMLPYNQPQQNNTKVVWITFTQQHHAYVCCVSMCQAARISPITATLTFAALDKSSFQELLLQNSVDWQLTHPNMFSAPPLHGERW